MDAVRRKVGILEQEPETSTSGRVRTLFSVTQAHAPLSNALCCQGGHMRGSMHCLQGLGVRRHRIAAALSLAACLHKDCPAC